MPGSRIILRIDISPRARERLSAICDRFGCTQLTLISRLVEWYGELPDDLRYALVGIKAAGRQSSRAILRHMIDKKS
jgi:hypothetical protein